MQHPRVACYKNIVNAFDGSLAHGYHRINNTTDVLGHGTKTYKQIYNWKGKLIVYVASDSDEALC